MLSLVSATAALNVGARAMLSSARMSSVAMASFHDFSATTLDGKETSFADYKGKPTLVLNVASL